MNDLTIVLKCHDCSHKDEPQNMYRDRKRNGLLWFCEDCYQARRKKFKGRIRKPKKVMSYGERQRIHKAKWNRFKEVVKNVGNSDSG